MPVVWFEVTGSDAKAQQQFYSQLFGWDFSETPEVPGYGMISAPSDGIPGGVGPAPDGKGWSTFYVRTPDIAGSLAQAETLGGNTVVPPQPLPDGSQFALIRDPDGQMVGLIQAAVAAA